MMTVAEAELVRRAAEKGRSASFCAPSQPLSALHAAHSSSDITMDARAHAAAALVQASQQQQQASSSPRSRLKASHAARRSQSCRVQGSRPPRVRRQESPRSSEPRFELDADATAAFTHATTEDASTSYNPFLRKVPSCGRLVTLTPECGSEDADSSPVLRRSASARRPSTRPPTASSPNHSPTPTRVTRPPQNTRQSGKKATGLVSRGSRRSATGGGGGGGGGSSAAGFLDVKPSGSNEGIDPDSYLLRNFSTTTKGIINRGDSFRRRRSRSNSTQPPHDLAPNSGTPPTITPLNALDLISPPLTPDHILSSTTSQVATPESVEEVEPVSSFRMVIFGAAGVGKTALIHQFKTSECINAYDCSTTNDETEQSISILLNNQESEIVFVNISTPQELQAELNRPSLPEGWLLMYSITDKASFQRCSEDLTRLHSQGALRGRAVILVANKCELVRSRAVSVDDGRDLACSYNAKFMEISVGINHKCDDLLVGILNQLRLRGEAEATEEEEAPKERSWTRNRSLMRASMKAKRVINRIMGKTEAKYKSCEDFQS
ncbi:uncharacterized protein LOC123503299 isoform X2 [Portunus trituberculatus]|uniref:uncharacterized protein LOC123503299 isoform X2 n=1 Tax=Portunus trituberculatus TaxID=210409 RepID=UPI001E1D1F96|nr:uncharacterized protein LOC123503299 isoform X2 [Portunus trituberculatus]